MKHAAKAMGITRWSMSHIKSKWFLGPYFLAYQIRPRMIAIVPPWLARPPFQGMNISQNPFHEPK